MIRTDRSSQVVATRRYSSENGGNLAVKQGDDG